MVKRHGILVLIAVAFLMSAAGLTIPTIPTLTAAPSKAPALAAVDFSQGEVCSVEEHAERVPPGCCSTQCDVDRDCNRICGKGVCACIQETSCCRRCVY